MNKNSKIQSLRGLSVALVIFYHLGTMLPSGFIGVDIFFVISGYVVTNSSWTIASLSFRRYLYAFYSKRINRLIPSLLVFLFFCSIVNILFVSPNQGLQQWNVKVGISSLFGLSNFLIPSVTGDYFSVYSKDLLYLHTWSLGVELQVYILMGVVIYLFLRMKQNAHVLLILIALFMLSITFDLWQSIFSLPAVFTNFYFGTFGRIWEFILGMLAAYILKNGTQLTKRPFPNIAKFLPSTIMLLLALAALLPADFYLESRIRFLVPTILALIFIVVVEISNEDSHRNSIGQRFLRYLGDRSYSLYLYHYPIYVILVKSLLFQETLFAYFICLILSLFAAEASFKYVETKKLIKEESRESNRITSAIASVLAIHLTLGFFVSRGVNTGWSLPAVQAIARECDGGDAINVPTVEERCTWNYGRQFQIALIGDSLAWSTSESLIQLSRENHGLLHLISKNGCAATLPSAASNPTCNEWRYALIDYINSKNLDHVFIANNFVDSFSNSEFAEFLSQIGLESNSITVILPGPFGDSRSERMFITYSLVQSTRNVARPELMDLSQLQRELRRVGISGVETIDLRDEFCDSKNCLIAENGREYLLYGNHLSNNGNDKAKRAFEGTFQKILENIENK